MMKIVLPVVFSLLLVMWFACQIVTACLAAYFWWHWFFGRFQAPCPVMHLSTGIILGFWVARIKLFCYTDCVLSWLISFGGIVSFFASMTGLCRTVWCLESPAVNVYFGVHRLVYKIMLQPIAISMSFCRLDVWSCKFPYLDC